MGIMMSIDYGALISFIEKNMFKPFKWGEWDCCLFAAECVKVACGVDYMPEFRGKYNCERSARLALRQYGEGTLKRTMNKKMKAAKIHEAMRGDVVYKVDRKYGPCLGVCMGSFSLFIGDNGLVKVRTVDCLKVYKHG